MKWTELNQVAFYCLRVPLLVSKSVNAPFNFSEVGESCQQPTFSLWATLLLLKQEASFCLSAVLNIWRMYFHCFGLVSQETLKAAMPVKYY